MSGIREPARRGVLTLILLSVPALGIAAERQIRPFVGVTFGADTTFVDLERTAGKAHTVIGVNTAVLGEIVGVEFDVAHAPGFFTGSRVLVLSSGVTTVTGNVVLAAPAHKTQYGLRPYFVGGAGLMRVTIDHFANALPVAETLPAIDLGGGAIGSLTNRLGVCWDVRRFISLSRTAQETGISFGAEQLSFWRASMALAIRY